MPVVDILRFNTCGSVDDGKSTSHRPPPIGFKVALRRTQIEGPRAFRRYHRWRPDHNLANLTDGLRAEREQGITIDVAYRYFATPKRKFIIADYARPRAVHAQHGDRREHAPNSPCVLVDARHGVIEQTAAAPPSPRCRASRTWSSR